MALLGMPAYKKLKSMFYLFLVTMAVYLINTLFILFNYIGILAPK